MSVNDHDTRMIQRGGLRLAWLEEWRRRTRRPEIDTLTPAQDAEVRLLMRARQVRRCRGCGVVFESDSSGRYGYCSPLCSGR